MSYVSTPFLFPFCIPDAAIQPPPFPFAIGNPPFSVGISLETLVKWYWRVNQWTVTYTPGACSASATCGSAGVSIAGGGLPQTSTLSRDDNPTESELVCSNSGARAWGGTTSPGDADFDEQTVNNDPAPFNNNANAQFTLSGLNWTIFGNYSPLSDVFPVYYSAGLYYPIVQISASAFSRAETTHFNTATLQRYGGSEGIDKNIGYDPINNTGTTPVTIDGISYNWPCTFRTFSTTKPDGPFGSTSVSLADPTVIINPSSYFTFDPGDGGGPVWDSVTGLQLRDPFSIQQAG